MILWRLGQLLNAHKDYRWRQAASILLGCPTSMYIRLSYFSIIIILRLLRLPLFLLLLLSLATTVVALKENTGRWARHANSHQHVLPNLGSIEWKNKLPRLISWTDLVNHSCDDRAHSTERMISDSVYFLYHLLYWILKHAWKLSRVWQNDQEHPSFRMTKRCDLVIHMPNIFELLHVIRPSDPTRCEIFLQEAVLRGSWPRGPR